jgi:hypothetical protein
MGKMGYYEMLGQLGFSLPPLKYALLLSLGPRVNSESEAEGRDVRELKLIPNRKGKRLLAKTLYERDISLI